MITHPVHPLAGKPAPESLLMKVPKFVPAYDAEHPDPSEKAPRVAGDPIRGALTTASEDHRPIGGIEVFTDPGWFATRPSGTEAVLKIYAESFKDPTHLRRIQEDAYAIIQTAVATESQA